MSKLPASDPSGGRLRARGPVRAELLPRTLLPCKPGLAAPWQPAPGPAVWRSTHLRAEAAGAVVAERGAHVGVQHHQLHLHVGGPADGQGACVPVSVVSGEVRRGARLWQQAARPRHAVGCLPRNLQQRQTMAPIALRAARAPGLLEGLAGAVGAFLDVNRELHL